MSMYSCSVSSRCWIRVLTSIAIIHNIAHCLFGDRFMHCGHVGQSSGMWSEVVFRISATFLFVHCHDLRRRSRRLILISYLSFSASAVLRHFRRRRTDNIASVLFAHAHKRSVCSSAYLHKHRVCLFHYQKSCKLLHHTVLR
jgi:hypothetical protein